MSRAARRAAALTTAATMVLGLALPAAAADRTPSPSGGLAERLGDQLSLLPNRVRAGTLDAALGEREPGVLLVTTRSTGDLEAVRGPAGLAAGGARALRLSPRVAQVTVRAGREQAAATALAAAPGVVAVEPARLRRLQGASADPLYSRQWAHQVTRAESAWDLTTGSAAVTVAVIDSGVDARHDDLRGNVREQRRFSGGVARSVQVGSDNRVCADDHGTHVAGIVGAKGDDGTGVAGVNWAVSMLDYAVFQPASGGCSSDIVASDSDIIAAIRTAAQARASVINLSLGGYETSCSTAFQTVIDEARAAGSVVVAASGNGEEDPSLAGQTFVPASCNGVLSVGAVGSDTGLASYSTRNAHVDLAGPGGAPGVGGGVLSTVGENQHAFLLGTSMAAPYVAGVAALLRAQIPGLTPDQVEGLLEARARDLGVRGRDNGYGWGLVDAGASLALAASGARPVPAADPGFPVGGGGGGGAAPPPSPTVDVYRIAAGDGAATSAVPQAVAMSQSTYDDGQANHAVLARSDDYADALAGSALALGIGPLLFSGPTGALPAATGDELVRALQPGATVYLLGGPAALPATREGELQALGFTPVRLEGRGREETAVAVAREVDSLIAGLGGVDQEVVLLANGGNWPDAVAAGAVAAYYGLPLLLTPTGSLHPATGQALRDRQPRTVLVLGGPAAVSDATASAAASAAGISAATPDRRVDRVAGQDRYGTSVALAELFESVLMQDGVAPACVVTANLVRADGYAHVLSASTLAGSYGCVVVGAQGPTGDRLPTPTREYVFGFEIDGVLAGGRDVVSDAAGSDLLGLLSP